MGDGFSDVRSRAGRNAGRGAPSVHVALIRTISSCSIPRRRRFARSRTTSCSTDWSSAAEAFASMTRRLQRKVFSLLGIGARRRAAALRLPARGAARGRAAARRHRVRLRPHRDAAGWSDFAARRDRVPEDDRGASAVRGRAVSRSARRPERSPSSGNDELT